MPLRIHHRFTGVILRELPVDSLRECDLSGADLGGGDFQGIDLTDSDLSGANLAGADLRRADLSGADLSRSNLSEAVLAGASLQGAALNGAILRSANLSGVNLEQARLRTADLTGADLSNVQASGADFESANLTGCALRFADLRSARLSFANVSGADLTGAVLELAELREAVVAGSRLDDANLGRTDIRQAHFQQCSFANANFARCSAAEARLKDCDLTGVNFTRADLRGAGLRGSLLEPAILIRAQFDERTRLPSKPDSNPDAPRTPAGDGGATTDSGSNARPRRRELRTHPPTMAAVGVQPSRFGPGSSPQAPWSSVMIQNKAKARLAAGQAVVGAWLSIPSLVSARFMASLNFDYLTVDMEHMPIDLETASAMFSTIAAAGGIPLARVPWNTAENIKRVLDCGAYGIVVPMVNTPAEAEAAVAAAKYPPRGIRSVGGSIHAMNFGTDPASYYARANDEILVVVQAESPEGVANADEILAIPGIDAVFIGPNDLLSQMGKTPRMETDDPEFVAALAHIVAMAEKHGVAAGIHTANAEACNRRMAEGFRFMAIASDARFAVAGGQLELSQVRLPSGESHADRSGGGEVLRY